VDGAAQVQMSYTVLTRSVAAAGKQNVDEVEAALEHATSDLRCQSITRIYNNKNNNNNIYSPEWPETRRATAHQSWLLKLNTNTVHARFKRFNLISM